MRQTLFYITLNSPFGWNPQGTADRPILHIGLGIVLLALLAAIAGYSYWVSRRSETAQKNFLRDLGWNAAQTVGLGALVYLLSPMRIFPVYGYGMMLLVGFVAAASWAGRRAVKVGIPRETVWDVAMLILVAGIVGARSFYLLQYGDRVYRNVTNVQQALMATVNLSEGGLVLYGGVILGAISYFVFCAIRRIHPLQLADVITPSIFMGIGFGRIGCLFNGCCYGDRCDLPWAIEFPAGSVPYTALLQMGFITPDAASSLPLHPSQIYSSLGGFLLAFVTATVFAYRRKAGEVLAVGAIFYPINRFLIEFVRGDEFTQMSTGLTISQLVSLGVFAAGTAYLVWLEMYGKPLSQTPARTEATSG